MNLPDLQTLWEFLQDNWNLLAGVATTLVAIATGTTALFRRYRQHRRRQLIAGIDAFPFEVLQPYSKNVLSRLLRESQVIARDLNEPLADFNIPYQTRRNNRNTRQELENALEETGWLLILGSAGLGKTREASELAKLLNNEGWTIFKYLEGEWLDIPASFPSDICDRRKLLFFIDNLHRITYRGRKREFAPGAENPSQPLKVPFQERLLDVLRYFEDECDSDQIRIIAISRNEIFPDSPDSPSNLEKLELDNFSQLWERFRQYTLPEPDDSAIIQLLTDTVPKAGIQSKPEDYPLIAQRNDNTFNNIIENLKTIRGRNWCLSADTFLETQHGTWYRRYRRAAKQYPLAQHIYDAIDLLRELDVSTEEFIVVPTVLMLTRAHFLIRPWQQRKILSTLRTLDQTENILEPRDGQIEARGHRVSVKQHISSLLSLVLKLSDRYRQRMSSSLFSFANALDDQGFKEEAITIYKKLLSIEQNFHEAWNNLGYTYMGIKEYSKAIDSYRHAVTIKSDKYQSWDAMGIALSKQGMYQDAINSYKKALSIKADDWQTLYNRGNAFYYIGSSEAALSDWQRAGELNPNLSQAFYNQACVYGRLGDINRTLKHLEKAISINPEKYKELAKKDTDKYFSQVKLERRFRELTA